MNKKIFSVVTVAFILTSHLFAIGMGDFEYDNDGSSSSSSNNNNNNNGSASLPIDGGLTAVIIGAAGYAYKKLKNVKEE
jgi:hypothetical protein